MARNKAFIIAERLACAKNIFWEKGYQLTSMKDLVAAMSLNPGSIYGAYGDKHQLFIDSLKLYITETSKAYANAARSAATPLDAIKAVVHQAVTRSIAENKGCMVVKSVFELSHQYSDIHQIVKKENLALIEMLVSWIKKAQLQGQIAKAKDANVLATFIVANFAGIWQMQLLHNDTEMLKNIETMLINTIVN